MINFSPTKMLSRRLKISLLKLTFLSSAFTFRLIFDDLTLRILLIFTQILVKTCEIINFL